MTGTPTPPTQGPDGGIGASVGRPDGTLKVKGEFAYSSDLWARGPHAVGATLRSPHPYARIGSIEIAKALALPGVHAVQTHEDVPGRKTYGLEFRTSPCSRSTRFAIRASRWRSWRPTTPRPRAAPRT